MHACYQERRSKSAMVAALGFAPETSRMAARNTLDYVDATGVRRVRLHDTDILTIKPDGGFVVDTGGWNTSTTRDRLNMFLPGDWSVFTHNGRITLHNRDNGRVWPFLRHIEVGPRGGVRPDMSAKQNKRLQRLIDGYMAEWRKRGLPTAEESGGDPWVFGEVHESTMMDWLRSRYVFRLMFVLAHRHAGMSDYAISYYLAEADKRGLDKLDYSRIRRYIRACLGLQR